MTREEAIDKVLDEIQEDFLNVNLPLMEKMTLFAKTQNAVRYVADLPTVEPQEWISPTAESVSTEEAKKLLYQEFKGKIKDGNPRLLVAYEIAMKTLEEQTEWIPVTERLPKEAGCYVVTRKIGSDLIVSACYFDETNTWHNDNRINHERNHLTNIVSWMPLPEPYKGDTE